MHCILPKREVSWPDPTMTIGGKVCKETLSFAGKKNGFLEMFPVNSPLAYPRFVALAEIHGQPPAS